MAQEDVRLSGTFLDSAGNALANKTVTLFSEGTVTPALTTDTTDSAGEWDFTRTLSDLPGRYDVQLVTGTQTYRILSRDKFQVTELQARNPTTAQSALSAYSTTSEAASLVATFGFRPATESSGVETPDTPSDGDLGYIDFTLSNDHSDKQEWITARIAWEGTDVSDGTEDGQFNFWTMTAGTLVEELHLNGAALWPETDAGLDLGTSALGFNDLHLGSGGVINLDGGDVTLTHSSNTLTVAGGTFATAALTTSTIVASGIVKTDDSTDATSTTDGSLQTDGGLSVAKDAIFGNDIKLLSDSAVFNMGAGSDFSITHDGTTGATLAGNPIEIDSGGNITLDAHTGIFIFQDANTEILRITESGSGDVTIKLETNAKDLIFTDNGDATGLTIKDAAAGIVVPGEVMTTKISYTDGDDAITIADGGGITLASTLTATASLQIRTIDYSDGDLAITIADGGGITAAAGITSTAAANTLGATSFNDASITNVNDIALDSISADGTDINVAVSDNSATALTIKQGSDAYLIVDTANSSESVSIGTGISGTVITLGHSTSEVTVADNLTVTGDLTVSGATTTVDTATLTVTDPLIKLAQGTTASPAVDLGIIFTRGNGSASDIANRAILWDESADVFVFANTNDEAGTTTGNVDIDDYASIRVGALTADDASTFTGGIVLGTVAAAGTDTDKFLVLDGSGNVDYRTGTQVLSDIGGTGATALDDVGTGDAAATLATTVGNITLDAQATDADVVIKVDDNGSAVTAVTFDGSDEGNAIFVNDVQLKSDSALLEFGADLDTTLTHTDGTGLTLNSTNKLTFGDVASFIQQSSDGTLRIDGEAIIDLNASTKVDVSATLNTANLTIAGAQGSDGQVLTSTGSGVAWEDAGGGGGITLAAQWRVDQSTTSVTSIDPIVNWEVVDTDGYGGIGTAVTYSSGVFTFGATGIWLIEFGMETTQTGSDDLSFTAEIETCTDGSTFDAASRSSGQLDNGGVSDTLYQSFMFDVTNTSTHKVQFALRNFGSSCTMEGDSHVNQTYATFTKLGDT